MKCDCGWERMYSMWKGLKNFSNLFNYFSHLFTYYTPFLNRSHTSFLLFYEEGTDRIFSKLWHSNYRCRGITQQKAYENSNPLKRTERSLAFQKRLNRHISEGYGKVVLTHSRKAYAGIRDMAPLILKILESFPAAFRPVKYPGTHTVAGCVGTSWTGRFC
jgi:hypothetical protein